MKKTSKKDCEKKLDKSKNSKAPAAKESRVPEKKIPKAAQKPEKASRPSVEPASYNGNAKKKKTGEITPDNAASNQITPVPSKRSYKTRESLQDDPTLDKKRSHTQMSSANHETVDDKRKQDGPTQSKNGPKAKVHKSDRNLLKTEEE